MSIEAVKQFNHIAEADIEIQKILEVATDYQGFLNLVIKLGSEKGFRFTKNDLEKYYIEETITLQEITGEIVLFPTINCKKNKSHSRVCFELRYLARQLYLRLNSDQ